MTGRKAEILKELEQGRITASEAFTKLSQLPTNEGESVLSPPPAEPHSNSRNYEREPYEHNRHTHDNYEHEPNWVEGIISDVSGAVNEAIESIRDMDIGISISDFIGGRYGRYVNTLQFQSAPISQGVKKLVLIGKNARVDVHGYEGSVIRVWCKYDARREDAVVHFGEEAGTYQLMYDEKMIRSMEIVCEVPHCIIQSAHIASKNGRLQLENLQAGVLMLYTKNARLTAAGITCDEFVAENRSDQIRIHGIVAQNVHVETTNAKIQAENIRAKNAALTTTNAGIKTALIDVEHLKLNTTNNGLKLEDYMQGIETVWSGMRTLEAYTTNSGIALAVPADVGLKVQAEARGGKVTSKRHGMYFSESGKQRYAAGTSTNYEFGSKKLDVQLGTTNGTIKIRD